MSLEHPPKQAFMGCPIWYWTDACAIADIRRSDFMNTIKGVDITKLTCKENEKRLLCLSYMSNM